MKKYFGKLTYRLLFLLLTISCSLRDTATEPLNKYNLDLIAVYNINVSEPSGLTYNENTQSLWTVSDNDNKIYQLNLEGKVINVLPFVGDDLEGITYDFIRNSLWFVEEENRNLINISMEGNLISRYDHIIDGYDNSGLEGICITPDATFFIIKEKNPSLFIELNSNFTVQNSIETYFSEDLSGICYDEGRQSFWLVSDKSKKIFLWNKTEGIKLEFDLNYDKFEGIYYIEQENDIYLVNDDQNKLYYYRLINNSNS